MTAPAVIVCRGPKLTEFKRWDEGVHWCFTCRKRVQFWQIVRKARDEDIEASLGFWTHTCEPYLKCDQDLERFSIECEHGHLDGDLFPGRSREWDE